LEWTPSQLLFAVGAESVSVLKRNHTDVSVRHFISLNIKSTAVLTSCELHITTRKTGDEAVWAKVMGFYCAPPAPAVQISAGVRVATATRYDDEEWVSLPPLIREAFKMLGWTREIWDNDGAVPTDDLLWKELSEEGREAATAVGLLEEVWDSGRAAHDGRDFADLPQWCNVEGEQRQWTRLSDLDKLA
jgi:hypothetical protein